MNIVYNKFKFKDNAVIIGNVAVKQGEHWAVCKMQINTYGEANPMRFGSVLLEAMRSKNAELYDSFYEKYNSIDAVKKMIQRLYDNNNYESRMFVKTILLSLVREGQMKKEDAILKMKDYRAVLKSIQGTLNRDPNGELFKELIQSNAITLEDFLDKDDFDDFKISNFFSEKLNADMDMMPKWVLTLIEDLYQKMLLNFDNFKEVNKTMTFGEPLEKRVIMVQFYKPVKTPIDSLLMNGFNVA